MNATAPIRVLRHCRYCGEADWLTDGMTAEEQYGHAPDGSLLRQADGSPELISVSYIECLICGSMAPGAVWDGEPITPAMRAALVAQYLSEGATPEIARAQAAVQ